MASPLVRLAQQTDGIFTRVEARAQGMTNKMIRTALTRGELAEPLPGVLQLTAVPGTWRLQMRAALLWASPAVASHRAAAAIWQLDGCAEDVIELTTTRRVSAPGIHIHRASDLSDRQPRTRKGLRVTSVERTLLDLGAVSPPTKLENALDDALRKRLTVLPRLRDLLEAQSARGRNGCGPLRRLVTVREETGSSESPFERALFARLRAARLPLPVKQHPVCIGGRNFRFDLAYPHLRLAVEALGYGSHGERNRWERDQDRHNLVTVEGWQVLYVTYRAFAAKPEAVLDVIRRAHDHQQSLLPRLK